MFAIKKIVIADDHPLFREALQQAVMNSFGELEIISSGSFSSLQRSLNRHSDADLILLDLHMPGAVGFSTLHYLGISYPQLPVIIISANEENEIISRALKHGASGFIPKSSSIETIVSAIKQVIEGVVWVPQYFHDYSIDQDNEDEEFVSRLSSLTPKQFRVLMMLIEGRTNSEIAAESHVTIATIKAHLSEIFKKLSVNNRTQAAMIAANHLEVEDPNTLTFQ